MSEIKRTTYFEWRLRQDGRVRGDRFDRSKTKAACARAARRHLKLLRKISPGSRWGAVIEQVNITSFPVGVV